MYPDQSLYPADSVPSVVRKINNCFKRADEIHHAEGDDSIDWYVPVVADAEAGFGGVLNAFELMKAMIEAGAAGVHFEDQLASAKKCGHMGGKVLVSTQDAVQKLISARLAADTMGVPTVLLARTDAEAANLVTSDADPRDHEFLTGERTSEGFFRVRNGMQQAVSRGLAYAPYVDLIWCETGTPDLGFARQFAEAIHAEHPGKMLAYNCSPSFNWKKNLDDATIARFQRELGAMGYKFQFITLAGWHALNYHIFDLADKYRDRGMTAYVELQEHEFDSGERGYSAAKHQREVGAGYFDAVTTAISGGASELTALSGSTEGGTVRGRSRDCCRGSEVRGRLKKTRPLAGFNRLDYFYSARRIFPALGPLGPSSRSYSTSCPRTRFYSRPCQSQNSGRNVVASISGGDKPESFGRVEPLYGSPHTNSSLGVNTEFNRRNAAVFAGKNQR